MKKLLLLSLFCISLAWSKESVTLQLPWLHQFQFAGYYIAKEKGYYADAGLDVTVLDADQKNASLMRVLEGKAQYGVGHSSLIVNYINGAPLVLMAAIYQSSPMVLLTRKDSHINGAKDLKNRRVMLTNDMVQWAEIQAMFGSVGLTMKDLRVQPHSYDPMSLARGETDAMVAYASNEPFTLKQAGIETSLIDPKDYGFDYYSDFLFTSKEESTRHPERVNAFHDASMRGWLWAFDHIEETAELIYREYNPQHKSLEALIYEGKVLKERAFRPNTTFGAIDPVRLEMIAQGYRLMGVVKSIPSFEPLLYKHDGLQLSDQEREWLRAHPVIRVGIDHGWPPIESLDEKGRHAGISAAYLQLLEKRLGVRFEVDYSRQLWSDSIRAVKNKELDMLSAAAITDKRRESLVFSRPYLKQSMVIVANSRIGYVNDLNDLSGKKGLGVVSYLMEKHSLNNIKVVGETPFRYDIAFAFRDDWGILASISDKVLASTTPSEYEEIHGDFLLMEKDDPIDYRFIWGIVGFFMVLFLLVTYKNRRLDVLVRQRTTELETFNQRLQEEIEKAVEKNRKQEKLLMQQAKMAEIGSMLESIAHQWRQPLNILGLSMTRLNLSCAIEGKGDAAKVIEIAEAQIEYMSQTIDDFRNFFKQDRSQISVNINGLVNEVEALLGPLLARKKISIEREIDPSIEVLVYPNELKQVLINLVNNAREAIEHHRGAERVIRIRCISDEHYCTIVIEDTGGGIDALIIDKIFDPYFTTKFESQGTGIGLYMAKTIIEKHFLGKLSVYNTNKGACFEIRLNQERKKEVKDSSL
jgi:signal transduction histidine kinase/ABC-type nitrate/sulfonate/bicarbonate transport system substrate-binding protein